MMRLLAAVFLPLCASLNHFCQNTALYRLRVFREERMSPPQLIQELSKYITYIQVLKNEGDTATYIFDRTGEADVWYPATPFECSKAKQNAYDLLVSRGRVVPAGLFDVVTASICEGEPFGDLIVRKVADVPRYLEEVLEFCKYDFCYEKSCPNGEKAVAAEGARVEVAEKFYQNGTVVCSKDETSYKCKGGTWRPLVHEEL